MAASSSRSGGKEWREQRELVSPDGGWSEVKRVAVLYYLSRNGHLDHPHFMEVPLSSPPALFLKDVINRLNVLRGRGMASMYSWSCKRSYKNGFVWHDLSENDLIYAAHANDYILKGSELPENAFLHVPSPPPNRRNHSCTSIAQRVEIEVSTPPSDSSPETLATLMKADGPEPGRRHIQRCRSSVLMQLISCGSMPFKDCGAGGVIGQQRKIRGTGESRRVKLEEKEYFSGSLVEETRKQETPAVRRSNSYNADRSLNLEVAEKEIERVKAKCIPTKHRHTRPSEKTAIPVLQYNY